MPSLDLSAITASLLFAAPAAAAPAAAPAAAAPSAAPEAGALDAAEVGADADAARSVAVDIVVDIGADADAARAADACMSEMSFCDLAESVVPSDSASQVFSPRRELQGLHMTCRNFDELHATLCPADDAFAAWKRQCEREEAAAREQATYDLLVQRLLREHAARQAGGDAADAKGDLGMRHLVQSVRNIERSVAHLHLHFETDFADRGHGGRRPAALGAGSAPDAPQMFQSNTNANAPNMNRQHATGGRGRGRRHAHVG